MKITLKMKQMTPNDPKFNFKKSLNTLLYIFGVSATNNIS